MRHFIKNIAIFHSPLILGAFALFLFPVDKSFSYHFVKGECENKAAWIYSRIVEKQDNIDVVFTGASQTGCAVMDNIVSDELTKLYGTPTNAVNFGYCRRGRDIQYVMLKEFFRLKKPEILVIEVSEDEPKKSHPVFPYLAESSDLFSSFVLFNQRYFISIWRGILLRFEHLKWRFAGSVSTGYNNFSEYGYRPSSVIATAETIEINKLNWEKRLKKRKNGWFTKLEINYSKHYLDKIISLCNLNNCKPVFLYLPESGSKLKEPLYADYYRSKGELIILPENITGNYSNWKDATHFNDSGAMEASKFIVSQLSLLK